MPYRLQFLLPTEFPRLEGPLKELPPPGDHSLVLAAIDPDDRVIGTWAAIEHVTMEGLWVAEPYRGSPLPVRMFRTMTQELQRRGVPGITAIIENPSVISQAERLGFEFLPGTPMYLRF